VFSEAENEVLTRVGPGTPMGELMRSYWIPGLLSEEISGNDCDPKAFRLLGEDLVAFRDTEGRVGVMDVYCPHRLASLALGRNEEGGIRCIYHGWKIDVSGKILETPCEQPTSRLKDAITHRAYPTYEAGGFVWVYMGPKEKQPPFPDFHWLTLVQEGNRPFKMWESCNWAQVMEGALDTFHSMLLHSGYEVLGWTPEQIARVSNRPSRASYGPIYSEETPYGFRYAAIRTPIENPEQFDYVRITEFVSPCFFLVPQDLGTSAGVGAYVPIDDENTMIFQAGIGGERSVARYKVARAPNVELDENYKPLRTRENNYLQDRDMMRRKETSTSFTGIDTSPGGQDQAVVETMGPISDRTREHLGASDMAIVNWRNRMVNAALVVADGEDAPGLNPPAPYALIRSSAGMIPAGSDDWKSLTWEALSESRVGG
jgi:phthalate 4,5-dioxygenase